MPNHYKVVYCFFYDSSYGFECVRENERKKEGGEKKEREERERKFILYSRSLVM